MSSFIDRHQSIVRGVLGCYDRVVVQGTLPGICYADGMTALLDSKKIRIFDYPRFAEPFRDAIRADADKVAAAAGVTIVNNHPDFPPVDQLKIPPPWAWFWTFRSG